MKNEKRSAYHHGDLKNALVEAALQMVETEGYENLSIRDITQRVGTSRSAIYRHFPSKEALMQAVVMAGFEKLDAYLRPVLGQKELSLVERFHALAVRYVNFARQYPALYRMIFGDRAKEAREKVHDIHDTTQNTGFYILKELVDEAQEAGLLKRDDPMMQSTLIWSAMHGQSILLIDGHLHIEEHFDTLFEMTFNTLLEGLSTTSAKVQKVLGIL